MSEDTADDILRASRDTDYGMLVWYVREEEGYYQGIRKFAEANPDRPMDLATHTVDELVAQADEVEWVSEERWNELVAENRE